MLFNETIASRFVMLPLRGVTRQYPNLIQHLINHDQEVQTPKSLHPIFYGCYDWHSCVHGYWLLAQCASQFPNLAEYDEITQRFEQHFTQEKVHLELEYFQAAGRTSFSRPYGWAWLLALSNSLKQWQDPRAQDWYHHLQPLAHYIKTQFSLFLPKQTYPIRVGTHFNTAFALRFAREYALLENDAPFLEILDHSAIRYFAKDTNYPAHYEPNGDDFLSCTLIEILLMAEVLKHDDFQTWFADFLPHPEILKTLLNPAYISDRSDPKIGHLDGLNLSKSWCLKKIIPHLPNKLQAQFKTAADIHLKASIDQIANGHYTGEHWLATYAYLALTTPTTP